MKTIKFFVILVLMQISLSSFADSALSTTDEVNNTPWDQRSYEDKVMHSTYEDRYTFRHPKPYILDPWTWGYTKEFAERFRMPKQWVEPELKGALAVAWRMTTVGYTMCGYGKKEDSCWKPLNCQMDVYYDNKILMPSWIRPEIIKENRVQGLTSSRFLETPPKELAKDLPPPEAGPWGGGIFKYGKSNQAGGYVAYFNREFQEGIGLISWIGAGLCPTKAAAEYAEKPGVHMDFINFNDYEKYRHGKIKKEEIKVEHQIDFPQGLLKRMNALYEVQKKPNDEVTDSLLKNFFEQRKNKQ